MNNLEKLNAIFKEIFSVDENALNENFANTNVDNWDSVRQLSLVSSIEEKFEIMMDAEDILALTSYDATKQILASKYSISF